MKNFINKPLLRLESKNNLVSTITFAVIAAVLTFVAIALFPMMQGMMGTMPESLAGYINLNDIGSYFESEGIEMWIFLTSIFGAVLANSLTSKEFKNGSYETIYSLNLSRSQVIRTKLVRLILSVLYVNLASSVASIAGLLIYGAGQFSVANFLVFTLFAFLTSLLISLIVFAFGLFNKRFGMINAILVPILFFMIYAVSSLIPAGEADFVAYLSPFSTFKGVMTSGFKGLLNNGIVFGIWWAVVILFTFVSFKKFKNDDLC